MCRGYEGSPFCKVVREQLCELELPHLYRSCARGSPKRQELLDKWGSFQVLGRSFHAFVSSVLAQAVYMHDVCMTCVCV